MLKEFKSFIAQGSVLDLAVGVIIAVAFGKITSSLVDDIIMPIVGIALGGVDFSKLAVTFGEANIKYGNFIQVIINFLIIAWVVFMVIKASIRAGLTGPKPE